MVLYDLRCEGSEWYKVLGLYHPTGKGMKTRAGSKRTAIVETEILPLKKKPRPAAGKKKAAVGSDIYSIWKAIMPGLYEWLTNHNLASPSLSCRWGPLLDYTEYKNTQILYYSTQADGSALNTLVIANCDIVKQNFALARFNEEGCSPFVKTSKTIIHPGKVNRIRELPQHKHIIATHTDCPEVLIWNVKAQPNRFAYDGDAASHPDLVLTGHAGNAEFALAMCPTEPYVLSGGKDKYVVLWSIHDHVSTLNGKSTNTTGSIVKTSDNASVGPRGIFQGHTGTVEDVQFCPKSEQEFCSVGDDFCMILWDARVGTNPITKVERAHDAGVHCVDWNRHNENFILTGSADHSVCMFDRRNLTSNGVGSPVHKFLGHKAPVLRVQWCPSATYVFGSSAEDACIKIWDYDLVGKKRIGRGTVAPGLVFKHCGHRGKVVDFHWNAYEPSTIVSVSDDVETTGGGGSLQIWTMGAMYRSRDMSVIN